MHSAEEPGCPAPSNDDADSQLPQRSCTQAAAPAAAGRCSQLKVPATLERHCGEHCGGRPSGEQIPKTPLDLGVRQSSTIHELLAGGTSCGQHSGDCAPHSSSQSPLKISLAQPSRPSLSRWLPLQHEELVRPATLISPADPGSAWKQQQQSQQQPPQEGIDVTPGERTCHPPRP